MNERVFEIMEEMLPVGGKHLIEDMIFPFAVKIEELAREIILHKSEITNVIFREANLNLQSRRDAERADANAAEVGRLRVVLTDMLHLCEHDLGMDNSSPYVEAANRILGFDSSSA